MRNLGRASVAASGFGFAPRFGKALLTPGARIDETEDLKKMKLNVTLFLGATLAAVPALAFALSLPAAADEPAAQGDPGVARISDLAGGVDVRRADANDSFTAALNAPVNPGDYVTTQDDSRAEVEFDYAALLRVGPDTQIRFTQLDPHQHTLQLAEGTVELRVLRGLDAHPEVDTPSATIRPEASGRYRITVSSDGNTEVTVREGRADVALGDGASSQALNPGSTLLVTGQGSDVRSQTISSVAYDDFDRWTDGRDARYARVDDWAYVDRGIVGADDLGQYGHWTDSSDYGQVWTPNDQPAGWAPYSDGRWVWEPYYGWTWVAAEPWGWAPYHYGRWFYAADAGWCWYPGAYSVADPYVYEPAVVGFFGYGGGIDINLGFGNIGWTALAPFEAFHPWWGHRGFGRFGGGGDTFAFNNFGSNFGNTFGHGNINRLFHNASAPGGVMGVSGSNFASGHFEHIQPVHGSQLGAITPVRGVLPILPTTRNLAVNPRFTEPVHTGPLSPRFEHLTPLRGTTPLFNEQRNTIAALAKQQFPHLAPSIDRQVGAERSGASPAERFTEGAGHAAFAPVRQNSVWERFGGQSSVPGAGSVMRGTPTIHENNAFREDTPVHDATTERASSLGRDSISARTNGEGWNHSSESGGGHSETFERRPAYAAPERSSVMPERSTFAPERSPDRSTMTPERSPIIPRVQTFSQSGQSFSRSVEPYSPPSRSFSQPARSFSEPARSFSQPARSFSAPARSFSAPTRSFSAPARSYSAPRTYSAPAHTSSGNTRSGDGRNRR